MNIEPHFPMTHPLVAGFPMMSKSEISNLAEDIAANGLRRPIVLHQGKVWDGRARQEACIYAGIKPSYWILRRHDPIIFLLERHDDRYGAPRSPERTAALNVLHRLDDPQFDEEFRRERGAFISAARREFRTLEKAPRPCDVCHKHVEFVHAHHSIPLAIQLDLGLDEPSHEHDWLCPSHHKIVHVYVSIYLIGSRPGAILDSIPDRYVEEWVAAGEVFERGQKLFIEYGGVRDDLGRWQQSNG